MPVLQIFAQAGASLGVMLKTKDKDLKQIAMAATIPAFLVGITEPAIYGVNLKYKNQCMVLWLVVLLVVSLLVFLVLKPMKWGIQIFLLYQSSVKLFLAAVAGIVVTIVVVSGCNLSTWN